MLPVPQFSADFPVDACCASPIRRNPSRKSETGTPHQHAGLAEIVPGALYLGAIRDVARLEADSVTGDLHAAGDGDHESIVSHPHVGALVSVAAGVGAAQLPAAARAAVAAGRVAFMHLPLEDALATRLEDAVGPFAAYVDAQRARGRAVAVFCREGRSRSVACAIAYLMRREGLGFDAALAAVRRARPQADPNLSFVLQLSDMGAPDCVSGGGDSAEWPAFPVLDVDAAEQQCIGRRRDRGSLAQSSSSAWRPVASCSSRAGLDAGHPLVPEGSGVTTATLSPMANAAMMPSATSEIDAESTPPDASCELAGFSADAELGALVGGPPAFDDIAGDCGSDLGDDDAFHADCTGSLITMLPPA